MSYESANLRPRNRMMMCSQPHSVEVSSVPLDRGFWVPSSQSFLKALFTLISSLLADLPTNDVRVREREREREGERAKWSVTRAQIHWTMWSFVEWLSTEARSYITILHSVYYREVHVVCVSHRSGRVPQLATNVRHDTKISSDYLLEIVFFLHHLYHLSRVPFNKLHAERQNCSNSMWKLARDLKVGPLKILKYTASFSS